MRVKLIQEYLTHKAGDIIKVSRKEARSLIDKGLALVSKDMSKKDYKKK